MPIGENCPPVSVGVCVKVRVGFNLGGQTDNYPQENCRPVRVRVWVRINFGVEGKFTSMAIVLEP